MGTGMTTGNFSGIIYVDIEKGFFVKYEYIEDEIVKTNYSEIYKGIFGSFNQEKPLKSYMTAELVSKLNN